MHLANLICIETYRYLATAHLENTLIPISSAEYPQNKPSPLECVVARQHDWEYF